MEEPHKRLIVWQKAYKLVLRVYELTNSFPIEERYGLITQIRRSAISIVSNIAEGAGPYHKKREDSIFSPSSRITDRITNATRANARLEVLSR